MKHYVYSVTNLCNGKYYIGRRTHKDPQNDSYMGSGKLILRAIEKYGVENFQKDILAVFETIEESTQLESILVTKDTIRDPKCYNMHIGGFGGFDHINSLPVDQRPNIISLREKIRSGELACGGTNHWTSESWRKAIAERCNAFRGRTHSKEVKSVIGEKVSQWIKDNGNSMTGRVWCVRIDAKDYEDRRSFYPDQIPEGWISTKEHRESKKKKTHSSYGRKWYNDGKRSYFLKLSDPKIQSLDLRSGRIR